MRFDGFGWFGFVELWMVILGVALIGVIVWAVIMFSKRDDSKSKVNHIEIAKERYARGEISKEEFIELSKKF